MSELYVQIALVNEDGWVVERSRIGQRRMVVRDWQQGVDLVEALEDLGTMVLAQALGPRLVREGQPQRLTGTEARRHRGTEAQRHKGTEAQRHEGTKAQGECGRLARNRRPTGRSAATGFSAPSVCSVVNPNGE